LQSAADDQEEVSLRRLRLLVAYRGTTFHGFAAQPGQRTVAGRLVESLERLAGHPVRLTCAGRTDTGVHAWGQVVSLDLRADLDPAFVARRLNRSLRPDIAIREASWAPPGFDARRWATGRRYHYRILNAPVHDPLAAGVAWHVERPLDLGAMRLACDLLLGEHDFSAFCRQPPEGSLQRLVREATWQALGQGWLRFEIEASSFCQQMVRSIVGTLVEVGVGRRTAADVGTVLRSRDRGRAGQLAPPDGLCLWEVTYGDGPQGRWAAAPSGG
jgi:tRNA pseudouridine38-40 synthase